MPKWMINFYWFCVAFLILVCIWLIFDYSKKPQQLKSTMKTPGVYIVEKQ